MSAAVHTLLLLAAVVAAMAVMHVLTMLNRHVHFLTLYFTAMVRICPIQYPIHPHSILLSMLAFSNFEMIAIGRIRVQVINIYLVSSEATSMLRAIV